MPTSTQTLKKEATNAALRYSRGKLRSSAMMSFTLSPSLSGQRHPKSLPVRLERRHDTMTPPDIPSVLREPHGSMRRWPKPERVPALDRLTRRRRALDRRIGGPDRRAQPEK